jgi:hypothetical protein
LLDSIALWTAASFVSASEADFAALDAVAAGFAAFNAPATGFTGDSSLPEK